MTSTPAAPPRKFTFDTIFDGERVIMPVKPKTAFTAEEVKAARDQGFAEGERSADARAQADAASAVADATRVIRQSLTALTGVAHDHRTDSARLALAVGRAIAGAALDQFPEQPVMAAMEALAREVEAQPRLTVRAAPAQAERLGEALNRAAEVAGFAGQVVIKTDPALAPAAFTFDWGDGRAAFDPQAAAARVSAALEQALAAEHAHAEPLPLDVEADA